MAHSFDGTQYDLSILLTIGMGCAHCRTVPVGDACFSSTLILAQPEANGLRDGALFTSWWMTTGSALERRETVGQSMEV
jgi:hypothetical protein